MTAAETARMELAYQITRFLCEHEMTADTLAQKCGVKADYIKQALEEESVPSGEMQKICGILGVSLDSLRHLPVSESFVKLQQSVLDTVLQDNSPSYRLAARDIADVMNDTPEYEQTRNFRWLRQSLEHPEMYTVREAPPKKGRRRHILRELFSKYPLASSMCFTRRISPKQKEKLEQMIEDSKKK